MQQAGQWQSLILSLTHSKKPHTLRFSGEESYIYYLSLHLGTNNHSNQARKTSSYSDLFFFLCWLSSVDQEWSKLKMMMQCKRIHAQGAVPRWLVAPEQETMAMEQRLTCIYELWQTDTVQLAAWQILILLPFPDRVVSFAILSETNYSPFAADRSVDAPYAC